MEFGTLPPMFGMGMVNSLSEALRVQQQAAEQALAQMQMQAQLEAMQPPQPAEPPTNPLPSAPAHQGRNDGELQTISGRKR